MRDLRWKVKDQLDLWYLSTTNVSLNWMIISKFSLLGIKFDFVVKQVNHHLCKLDGAHIPNATYQVPRSLAFWFQRRRYLKGIYLKWVWWPSWSCGQEHLCKLSFPHPKDSPYEILRWNGPVDVWKCWQTTDTVGIGIPIAHLRWAKNQWVYLV